MARHASEWSFSYLGLDGFVARSADLDEACRARGRDPASVARSVTVPVAVGRDDEVAARVAGHRTSRPSPVGEASEDLGPP